MGNIFYTRGNIAKAVDYLVTGSEPMPQRAWEAYQIIVHGDARDGMEGEFDELDSIFGRIRHDQIAEKVSVSDAIRGAMIMLALFDANAERRGQETVTA